jgi:hypothetical protein
MIWVPSFGMWYEVSIIDHMHLAGYQIPSWTQVRHRNHELALA